MALSNDLISEFVKATMDEKEPSKESTAYGKIVIKDGKEYVQLDGSELLTPISTTTVVKDEDRVMVTIKNHTAIVTGDLTNPSASNKDVTEIGSKITEVEILMADKVVTQDLEAINAYIEHIKGITAEYDELSAITAEIETLQAKYANMEHITATDAEILNAEIENLRGKFAEFTNISTQDLEAINAELTNLQAYNASFNYVSADKLDAIDANIKRLNTDKLDAETAKITYATIDFANINEAAVEKLFSDSGIIKDLVMSDGKVTGELVGVTIKGDIIEGNTVKADKLVILGTDGLYYKLNVDALGETTASSDEKYQNGLDGSVIVAESITAEKIAVDDLVAFGATIGGFKINNHAIYSGVKSSINNTTTGVYFGDDGQVNIGDQNNFFKYYIDENGKYRLEIQADSLRFGSNNTSIEEYVNNLELDAPEAIKEIEGAPLCIADGKKVIDFRVDGKSYQDTRSGAQKFKYQGLATPHTNTDFWAVNADTLDVFMTPLENGWAKFKATNSGTSDQIYNFIMNKKAFNLKPNTEYTMVLEFRNIVENATSGYFNPIGDSATVSYFTTVTTLRMSLITKGMHKYTLTSKADISRSIINSYMYLPPGESCEFECRMSILEGNYTLIDYEYEAYGAQPSPDYPSEIKSLGYQNLWNQDKVFTTSAVLEVTKTGFKYVRGAETGGRYLACVINLKAGKSYTFSIDERYENIVLYFYKDSVYGTNLRSGYNHVTYTPTEDITVYAAVTIGSTVQEIEVSDIRIVDDIIHHPYIPYNKYGVEIINESKNILKVVKENRTINGLTFTHNDDGSITINGTSTAAIYHNLNLAYVDDMLNTFFTLENGMTYTNYLGKSKDADIRLVVRTNSQNAALLTIPSGGTITTQKYNGVTDNKAFAWLGINAGQTFDNVTVYPMILRGSYTIDTIGDFEKYHERYSTVFALNQPLRSLPNGVKDTALIQNGVLTVERKVKSIVLNGQETIDIHNSSYNNIVGFRISSISDIKSNNGGVFCSHFKHITIEEYNSNNRVFGQITTLESANTLPYLYLTQPYSATTTVASLRTWLTNRNVEVLYETTSPTIEEVDGLYTIPMHEKYTDTYYVNNKLNPNVYCKYYTIYAGLDGKSAYEVWLEQGNTGSEDDFLNSNKLSKTSDKNTELIIDDGIKIINFEVEGESAQATRSGKNKFNVAELNSKESIISVEDSSFNITNCWAFNMMTAANIKKNLKPNTSYIATAKVTVVNKPTTMSSFNHTVILMLYDGTNSASMLYANNKNDLAVNESVELSCQFNTPSDLTNFRMVAYSFHGNNDGSTTYTAAGQLKVEKLMIREHIGMDDKFEAYGASPSPDYPSDIVSIGRHNYFNKDLYTYEYVKENSDGLIGGNYRNIPIKLPKANTEYFVSSRFSNNYSPFGKSELWVLVCSSADNSVWCAIGHRDASPYSSASYASYNKVLTSDENGYLYLRVYMHTSKEIYDELMSNVEVLIEEGSEKKSMIPYTGEKYGINVVHQNKNYYFHSGQYLEHNFTGTLDTDNTLNGYPSVKTVSAWQGIYLNLEKLMVDTNLKVGDTVTYSIYFKVNFTPLRPIIFSLYRATSANKNDNFQIPVEEIIPNTWMRIKTTFTLTEYSLTSKAARLETDYYDYNDQYYFGNDRTNYMWFACPQLEKGSVMTEWIKPFYNSSAVILNEPLRRLSNGVRDTAYIDHGRIYVDRHTSSFILDGDESSWGLNSSNKAFYYYGHEQLVKRPNNNNELTAMSDHFKSESANHCVESSYNHCVGFNTLGNLWMRFNEFTTLAELKTWLTNNPVKIVYELAEPITDYAGEVNIPMYKDETNIYYVKDNLIPYIQCEYYTHYAERVADLDQIYGDETSYLEQRIIEQKAEILVSTEGIVQKATESLVTRTDFDQYTQIDAKTEMRTEANGVFIDLNKTHNEKRFSDLEDDVGDIQKDISKHFSFTQDGLIIKSGPNSMKLQIDNEEGIIFTNANGDRVGYWDGNDFYAGNIVIRVYERAQFGNYAYIPKSDGSLMFTRVK